ncbi:zinc-ribbon domain-containing protein [Roseovarius sp. D22-M7]|uniref:zinc-ribbon domain-containing protein n=1 Tax=Roseovarius sp. D22-M7 TaxID=3127116 RepID=UPI00300FCBF3
MRLTCPNCGAQYEIPETAIPDDGREVQCSACGETWMQQHADAAMLAAQPPADKPAPPHPEPARRRLDPEIADILRSEAARERAKRAAEATGDVPLEREPSQIETAATQGRFPDPERINSSLTPSRGHTAGATPQDPASTPIPAARSGFGVGFWVVVIAFGLAAGVYLTAPEVIALVPEAEPAIERYVASVDGARLRLDTFVDQVIAQISGG